VGHKGGPDSAVITAENTEWTEEIIYLRHMLKAMNTLREYDMYV